MVSEEINSEPISATLNNKKIAQVSTELMIVNNPPPKELNVVPESSETELIPSKIHD